jgi:hypothetical protein
MQNTEPEIFILLLLLLIFDRTFFFNRMMLNIYNNSASWGKAVIQLAFLIFSIGFLGFYCSPTLKMIEQLQLFQFTPEYFSLFAAAPGGILMYVGKFITQFFFYPWMGVFIVAFLLLGIQMLLNKLFTLPGSLWAISFIPSIFLLILQTGTGHLFAHSFGIFLSLVLSIIYSRVNSKFRLIAGSLLIVFAYFLSGGHALLVFILLLFNDLTHTKSYRWIAIAFLLRTMFLAVVVLSGYFWIYKEYDIDRVLFGSLPDIVFMPDVKQKWLFIFTYTFIAVIALLSFLCFADLKRTHSHSLFFNVGLLALLMALVVQFSFTDKGLCVLLEMDQAVQEENWDKVLKLAHHYDNPERLITYYTNIALCKSGRMADEMFAYDQSWSQDGLFVPFAKNPIVPLFGGEVYYQLGLVNYAYRWTYEGMVMHEISARHLKRLYQAALINQEYELANKYGKTLSNGLFYDDWVKKTAHDPEIKQKRDLRPDEDFLLGSDFQFGALLRFAFDKNEDNEYLYRYMMAHLLLTGNLEVFVENLEKYPEMNKGSRLPRYYQEALMVYAMQHGDSILRRVEKFHVDETIREKLMQFNKLYNTARTSKNARKEVQQLFGDTYWYYYLQNRK